MKKNQEENGPKIIRAKVDSLTLYEVTDDELTTLEHGSPSSLYLLFSTFLISAALSFTTSLITTEIKDLRVYIAFVIITTVGCVIGLVLFFLWLREYRSSSSVSKKIRDRMNDQSINEELKATVTDPTSTLGSQKTDK